MLLLPGGSGQAPFVSAHLPCGGLDLGSGVWQAVEQNLLRPESSVDPQDLVSMASQASTLSATGMQTSLLLILVALPAVAVLLHAPICF